MTETELSRQIVDMPRIAVGDLADLRQDQVAVTSFDWRHARARFGVDRSNLSLEESARADRFVSEEDAGRFATCRATLRHLLGARLGVDPRRLRFVEGKGKKPCLAVPFQATEFNVAHSRNTVAIAVSGGLPVGIDCEDHGRFVRSGPETPFRLADRYFHPEEVALLRGLTDARLETAFLRIWTCKEAVLKAAGTGLATALDAFVVSDATDSNPALTWHDKALERPTALRRLVMGEANDVALCGLVQAGGDQMDVVSIDLAAT